MWPLIVTNTKSGNVHLNPWKSHELRVDFMSEHPKMCVKRVGCLKEKSWVRKNVTSRKINEYSFLKNNNRGKSFLSKICKSKVNVTFKKGNREKKRGSKAMKRGRKLSSKVKEGRIVTIIYRNVPHLTLSLHYKPKCPTVILESTVVNLRSEDKGKPIYIEYLLYFNLFFSASFDTMILVPKMHNHSVKMRISWKVRALVALWESLYVCESQNRISIYCMVNLFNDVIRMS